MVNAMKNRIDEILYEDEITSGLLDSLKHIK